MSLLLDVDEVDVEDEERMLAQVCAMEDRRSGGGLVWKEGGGGKGSKGDVRMFPAPPRP